MEDLLEPRSGANRPPSPRRALFPTSLLHAPVHGPMATRIIEPPREPNLSARGAAHATFACRDGAQTGAVRAFRLDVPRMCLAALWRSTERMWVHVNVQCACSEEV